MKKILHFLGICDWTKWSEPVQQDIIYYPRVGFKGLLSENGVKITEIHQQRECKICNKEEDRKVKF